MTQAVESAWGEVVPTATLGTERRVQRILCLPGRLGEVLDHLDPSSPERYLLEASAAISLYRRAGRTPARGSGNPPAACEPEDLPYCSTAAGFRLATILSGQHGDILPEWLRGAAKSCKLVPAELLPELLDWGVVHSDQVELLLPVIGRRGRWLAGLNPAWAVIGTATLAESATPELWEEAWQTGNRDSRKLLLHLLRAKSAQSGRELVISTWTEERAADRAAFLAAFVANLSLEDEPFLEAALDDRSTEVRQLAAELLARLPQSRLVERMTRRVQQMLTLEVGRWPLRRARIEVTLPEAFGTELSRDGIEAKPPQGQPIGEKAWWFQQMLAIVPPSTWSRLWGKSADDLLGIAAEGDWRELLHEGWIMATLRHREADWAEALLRIDPQRRALLDAMEPDKYEAFIRARIGPDPKEGVLLATLYHYPWSLDLTRLVVGNVRRVYFDDPGALLSTEAYRTVSSMGQFMHPDAIADVETLVRDKRDGSVRARAVEGLLFLLEFRRQMIEELTP